MGDTSITNEEMQEEGKQSESDSGVRKYGYDLRPRDVAVSVVCVLLPPILLAAIGYSFVELWLMNRDTTD
jgi:hypothetical protein